MGVLSVNGQNCGRLSFEIIGILEGYYMVKCGLMDLYFIKGGLYDK